MFCLPFRSSLHFPSPPSLLAYLLLSSPSFTFNLLCPVPLVVDTYVGCLRLAGMVNVEKLACVGRCFIV